MKSTYFLLGIAMMTLSSFVMINNKEERKIKSIVQQQQSEGEKLISKMDCVGCHKLDKKLVGPPYLDIAKKYVSNDRNINYLSDKIIKGGTGVWGAIPMAAHTTLKKDDAKKMAKYILSLNK